MKWFFRQRYARVRRRDTLVVKTDHGEVTVYGHGAVRVEANPPYVANVNIVTDTYALVLVRGPRWEESDAQKNAQMTVAGERHKRIRDEALKQAREEAGEPPR